MNRYTKNIRIALCAFMLSLMYGVPAGADHPDGELEAPDQANGKALYHTTCVACHGDNGKSLIPGVPDLRGEKSRLVQKDMETLLHNVDTGYQTPGSMMAMPPKGGNATLTEQDLVDILEYMRTAFCG